MFKLVVLFSVVALAAAKPAVWPLAYNAAFTVPAVSSVSQYSNGVVHGSPVVYGAEYSPYVVGVVPGVTALSQAPNSPAVVLDAVNGVPLDTPEVVASRIAHYQAKTLSGVHHLAKRSVVYPTYNTVVSPVASVAPGFRSVVTPLGYSSPYVTSYTSPLAPTYAYSGVVPKALSVHPW